MPNVYNQMSDTSTTLHLYCMSIIYFSNVLICVFLFLPRIYRRNILDKVSLAMKEQLLFLWEFRTGKPHLHITSKRLQKLYKHNNHNLGDQFHCCYLRPADPDILSQEDGGGGKRQTESRKERGIKVDISYRKDHHSCGLRIVSVEERLVPLVLY